MICVIISLLSYQAIKFAEIATQTVGIGNILTNIDSAFHHSYHSPSVPPGLGSNYLPLTSPVRNDKVVGTTIESPSVIAQPIAVDPITQQQPPSYQCAIIGNKECLVAGATGAGTSLPTTWNISGETNNQSNQFEKSTFNRKDGIESSVLNTNRSSAGAMKNMNSDVFL